MFGMQLNILVRILWIVRARVEDQTVEAGHDCVMSLLLIVAVQAIVHLVLDQCPPFVFSAYLIFGRRHKTIAAKLWLCFSDVDL